MNILNQTESLPILAGSEPLSKIAHEIYAHQRSIGIAITIAAENAGLSRRSGAGSKLEQNADIKARIAYLAAQEKAILDAKRKRVEERQWLWHEIDIAEFYEAVDEPAYDRKGDPMLDADGNAVMRKHNRLKPLSDIPPEFRACIESLTYTESGRPILKLYSKADANRELRKLNGLDAQRTLDEGENISRMSDEELHAELARQAQELGISITLSYDGTPR